MNNKELLKELEKRMSRYGYCDTWTHIEIFIKEYEALTKDKKPIRLKDVIKRIKGFDDETKHKWMYDIFQELGSDFASKVFHEGYQQGKFEGEWVGNQLKDADKIRQELNKPVVQQFVADWYEENKDSFEANLYRYTYNIPSVFDGAKLNEFERWFLTAGTKPFQTLVNMHQFGYTIEKNKRYIVKIIGITDYNSYLNYRKAEKAWTIESKMEIDAIRTNHTYEELEQAGFGWVFDCEGIEIEEVE
ncbi:DUF1642 domain-containing protein [Streptococcus mitis]|uniref:DUF1642 domain-containing protein n=1 Tax=Streptococcus mitis TaxID=28037 RepID=UPI003566C5F8